MPRNYSSTATEMTLQADVSSGSTVMSVNTVVGLPSVPFTLLIAPGAVDEEVVTATGIAGNNITITRGQDGTSASSHTTGAKIRHGVSARDFQEPNDHINASSGVHGVSGTLVGTTAVQTMDGKTFQSADTTGAPIIVKAAVGQSDTILAIQDSSAGQVAGFKPTGRLDAKGVDGQDTSTFTAGAAATVPVIVKGAASQSGALLSARNSSNTQLAAITAAGRITTPGVDSSSQSILTAGSASLEPLKVVAAASQTADLILVNNSGSTQIFAVTSSGAIESVGTVTALGFAGSFATLTSAATSQVPTTIKAFSGQTADLTQWLNSSNATVAKVDADGDATFKTVTESSPASWTSFTPTIGGSTSGGGIGNGTITGRYIQHGKTVTAVYTLTLGSTTSFGLGFLLISLPLTALTGIPSMIGFGYCADASTTNRSLIVANKQNSTQFYMVASADGNFVSGDAANPWNWQVSDEIRVQINYEVP